MTKFKKIIGLDVGGSHVSAAIMDVSDPGKQPVNLKGIVFNAQDTAGNIVNAISNCIRDIAKDDPEIDAVGIAFPGPFDYAKGVCAIAGVGGKFESAFGLHMQQAIKDNTGLSNTPIRFSNDAHCFATGAYTRHGLKSKKTVFLTLGTGFGSAFMEDGNLLTRHPLLPASGLFYDQDFLNGKADDFFSSRWILQEYENATGNEISSVKKLAESNSEMAVVIFNRFGLNLGNFLLPWITCMECDELVIGGNISGAFSLFGPALQLILGKSEKPVNIIICSDTEECIVTGAAIIAGNEAGNLEIGKNIAGKRKTTQPLLPVTVTQFNVNGYDVFPHFHSDCVVHKGYDSLADWISNEKTLVIEGYGGVLWEELREQLHAALRIKNKKVFWYDINACVHSPEKINRMITDNLGGDDPVFGKKFQGSLAGFFDPALLSLVHPDPSIDLCILYGTGAALCNWKAPVIYVDVPKNEIQYRMRAGSVMNLGSNRLYTNSQMYKHFYFVDWPVLNKHKEKLLPQIDCIADEQRIHEITWMNGNDFRNELNKILEHPFRARPWFEAGVWGGDWMKKKFAGLNKEEVNYAWSFELITPENGMVIEGEGNLMEFSFDFLLYFNNKKLLGKAAARFGTEFPIRFDFLDTCNGGNLSIQCHPRTHYIKENFGENFTQDETYYILDCEPDANVYLGFQEDINPDEFKAALFVSQNEGTRLMAEKFVQKLPAHKHDLFLIPNGTIHASGKNNLVLEISSTPYIYTFKMYDWQRLDLNGQPRPINIEHAFNNLYFDRKGDYVDKYLISKPAITAEWDGGRRWRLPTHEEHFYTVDRYEFTGTIEIATNEQCHICMLVEGESVEVIANGESTTFQFAETFVIPAAVEKYTIQYNRNGMAYLLVAYIKDEACL